MENVHLIAVNCLPVTNNKPIRVKIRSERFEETIILSMDYAFNNIADFAADYLTKKGFKIKGIGELKNSYYLISETFKGIKTV